MTPYTLDSSPLFRPLSGWDSVPVKDVAALVKRRYNAYLSGQLRDTMSSTALFYALQDIYYRANIDKFSQEGKHLAFLDQVYNELSGLAEDMFYYCYLIITREYRHAKSYLKCLKKESKTPKPVYSFETSKDISAAMEIVFAAIKGNSSSSVAQFAMTSQLDFPIPAYVWSITRMFYDGKYASAYGGPKWGDIAATMYRFVSGQVSPVVFCDLAFNLCHNNGPIFNKGMLFTNYPHYFVSFLDVQRGGQVLELAHDIESCKELGIPYEAGYLRTVRQWCAIFGIECAPVDWIMVRDLGSVSQKVSVLAQKQLLDKAKQHGSKLFPVDELLELPVIRQKRTAA